jgi:exonuclease VII small subunit
MSDRQTLEELMRSFRFHKNPILNWFLGEVNYYSHTLLNGKWKVKNIFQKLTRGYTDSDCWNLPQSTAKFMLPRIKHLRQNYHSLANRHHLLIDDKIVPYVPQEDDFVFNTTLGCHIDKITGLEISLDKKEYEYVLDEIIFALQMIINEEDSEVSLEEVYEVYPKGFDPIKDCQMFLDKQEDGTYLVEFERKENIQPDYSKLNKAYERQRNGLILLGLYFRDLWD